MVKLLAVFALLLAATGCGRPCQRFVDFGGAPLALDTKTGQMCNAGPKKTNDVPLCYDLYKHE